MPESPPIANPTSKDDNNTIWQISPKFLFTFKNAYKK